MSDVIETIVTADGVSRVFGVRHPAGTEVAVHSVDGFSFPTREAADTFTASPWPRTLPDGSVVTSDRVKFPASRAAEAATRQANIDGRA